MLPIGLYELSKTTTKKKLKQKRAYNRKPPTTKPLTKDNEMPTWEGHIQETYGCKCYHCPGLYANELMKFVGFRGYEVDGVCTLDIKGDIFEGEAHPIPNVPVTNKNRDNLVRLSGKSKKEIGRQYYLGILKYEVEVMTLVYTLKGMGYENIMVLMGRGHGKTYMEDWGNSMDMKYWKTKVLLLSESDQTLMVGNWIYMWAFKNKYLKYPEKLSKTKMSTYLHFELKNESKLDVYKYMDKKTLGMHEIKIVGDDMVNLYWQNRPTELRRAKEHWQHNLNPMNRTYFEIWGTCKFEGDLLQHFQETIEDLVVIKLSPFVACEHNPVVNENGVFEECHICRDLSLLSPEIKGFDNLMDIKEEDYEAWHSEYMQNPQREEGGMVAPSDICYVPRPHWTEGVIMGGTGVDLADTLDVRNDMCGIVSCLSHRFRKDKRDVRAFTVYNTDVARRLARNSEVKEKKKPYDWVEYDKEGNEMRIVRGVIESVQIQCDFHMINYPNIPYIVAWERNKSGIAVMEQALREFRLGAKVEIEKGVWVQLTWPAYLIPDKGLGIKLPHDGNANIKLGINHMGMHKENRVEGELKWSIVNDQLRFTVEQKYTVFMSQLLGFPKKKHDDGPDAAGMIKDELNRRWQASVAPRKSVVVKKAERDSSKYAKDFKKMSEPWTVQTRTRSKRVL